MDNGKVQKMFYIQNNKNDLFIYEYKYGMVGESTHINIFTKISPIIVII